MTEETTMKSVDDRGMVPKLRFHEFRDAGEWEEESFRDLYSFKPTNSFSRDMLSYENGSIKNIHYGDIHTKFSTLFDIEVESPPFIDTSVLLEKIKPDSYCVVGDIVFADASEDLDDIGKSIEIVNLGNEKLLSGQHTLLARQIEYKLIVGFGGYLFESGLVRNQIKRESQGTKVLGISAGRLASIRIVLPPEKNEQKKIADCLSSIDEQITQEAQKLDTLKTHKQGLMQQLFPTDGETLPKLRFPEFRDAGKWEAKNIIDLAIGGLSNGVFNDPGKVGYGYKIINVSDMYIETAIDESSLSLLDIDEEEFITKKVEPNDIFFTRSSLVKAGIAQSNIYLGRGTDVTFDGHLIRLRPDQNLIAPMFMYYVSKSGYARAQLIAKGKTATMTTIGQKDIASVKLLIPFIVDEQQRIADCLSSLDDLISAQTKKLDALKIHKKGLMQQLFPTIEDSRHDIIVV